MKILLFVAAGVLSAQPYIRLEPAFITSCQDGAGQATVIWNALGRALVTVYAGDSPMSGPEAPVSSAQTGQWVTDGMVFSLRDAGGETLASTRAVVKCDATSWWPLDAGNEWHFRRNDRTVTGAHAVWRVARKERIDGVEWTVLDPGPWSNTRLRTDGNGRIYRLDTDGKESLLIDPSGVAKGDWAVEGRTPVAMTLAGSFVEEVTWRVTAVGLGLDSGRLGRGVGPTYYQTNAIGGSSGGFLSGLTLLEAVIGGARFLPNYPRVELILETQAVNFGAKTARNCAIPCYFVACGFFFADGPDTYKPCIEASVKGGGGRLALLDVAGTTVFETVANGWVRIPLYRAPATLLPAGKYSVVATVNGAAVTLPLEIQ